MKTFTKKLLGFSLLALIMLIGGQVFAQETIRGTVSDADTGEPLPGVSIIIPGTTT